MYPIAQNKTVISKELYDEAYLFISRDYRAAIRKCVYVLLVVMIASFVFIVGSGKSLFYLFTEMLFLCCLLFYIGYYAPHSNKKKTYKKMAASSKETPWRKYTFYQDHIVLMYPDNSTVTIYYNSISRVYQGEKIMMLVTPEKKNMVVDKNGFFEGASVIPQIEEAIRNASAD